MLSSFRLNPFIQMFTYLNTIFYLSLFYQMASNVLVLFICTYTLPILYFSAQIWTTLMIKLIILSFFCWLQKKVIFAVKLVIWQMFLLHFSWITHLQKRANYFYTGKCNPNCCKWIFNFLVDLVFSKCM